MASNIFMGNPGGANPSGSNTPVPGVGGGATPAMGGASSPFTPQYPGGTKSPNAAAFPFPANGSGDPNSMLGDLSGLNIGGMIGGVGSDWYKAIQNSFHKAGYGNGLAALMSGFLANGAGFNPQVANAMIAALQPQLQRGQANIMEQFGSMGLRNSSPAAIGLGDFNSQAVLNEGQILSQMYEQSVQNYMQMMLAGKEPEHKSSVGAMIGGILNGTQSLAGILSKSGPGTENPTAQSGIGGMMGGGGDMGMAAMMV